MAERLRATWARFSVFTRSSSRMRWSRREVGESLRVMALPVAASRMEAAWSRVRARRTSASAMVVALSLVGVVVDEGIVGLHVVRLDVDVVGGGIAGDDGLGRLAEAAGE